MFFMGQTILAKLPWGEDVWPNSYYCGNIEKIIIIKKKFKNQNGSKRYLLLWFTKIKQKWNHNGFLKIDKRNCLKSGSNNFEF